MNANGNGVCTFKPDTHEYAIDGVPVLSVTQVLELGGITTGSYDGVNPTVLDYARVRGEKVDLACDLIDQGALDWTHLREKAPMLVPYAEAWKTFRQRSTFRFDGPRLIDDVPTYKMRLWSKQLGLAGEADRVGTMQQFPALVDIKAVSKLLWHYAIQTAGYTLLWLLQQGVPLGEPMRKAFINVSRGVTNLKKDGTYHHEPYVDPEDLDVFLGALVVAQRRYREQRRGSHGRDGR